MKLTPTAKPIRFRISSGGEEHSSIESLRNNYSITDVHKLVNDGRLYEWLSKVGETKAAEAAYNLIGSNTYVTSKGMVELSASIFNTTAKRIEDLLLLWQRKYPKSFFNHVKDYGGTFRDISVARQAYNLDASKNGENSGMTSENWKDIFVTTLKRMPLTAVLEDFKKFQSAKPMDDMAWLTVLKYHSDSASDKDLYLIAQATYNNPYLKDEAVEWYLKSAHTYIKAKEWVNKNIKRLDPKEEELFNKFEKDAGNFSKLFFNQSYPQNLVRFLSTLSSLYSNLTRPCTEQISGRGEYSKYLYIINHLYDLNYRKDKVRCIQGLKQILNNRRNTGSVYAYHFGGYNTLDQIINSLERDEPIFGDQLSKLSYQDAIRFIARLAKTELKNEK